MIRGDFDGQSGGETDFYFFVLVAPYLSTSIL